MKDRQLKKSFFILVVVLLVAASVGAKQPSRNLFISELYGSVSIRKAGTEEFVPAKKDVQVALNDEIRTGKDSYCEIAFDDKLLTVVAIKENSDLIISNIAMDPSTKKEETLLDLKKGSVLTRVDKLKTEDSKFQIKTPTAIVGVRGTDFQVNVGGQE